MELHVTGGSFDLKSWRAELPLNAVSPVTRRQKCHVGVRPCVAGPTCFPGGLLALERGVDRRQLLYALALERNRYLFVAAVQEARDDDARAEGGVEDPIPRLEL